MTTESQKKFNDFLELITNPFELFDELNSIRNWHIEGKNGRPKSDEIIKKLNNEGHCKILTLAKLALEQGESAFDVMLLLNPIMHDLTLAPSDLISYWKVIHEKTRDDMASGTQFEYLPEFLKKKSNLIEELLDRLKKANEPFTASYMSEMRCILAEGDFDNQFADIMQMTKSKNQNEVIAGVNALARLKYSGTKKQLISRVRNRFEELESNASPDVLFALTQSYGILLVQRKSISKKLVSFLAYDTAEIDYALSRIIFVNRGNWQNEDWYKKIFNTLSRTSTKNKGIINYLDYVAKSYMEKPNGFPIVEKFLLDWLKNSDYSPREERFGKLFDSVSSEYLSQRDELERFITQLFNSEYSVAHSLAGEFVSSNSLRKRTHLRFSKSVLKQLTMDDLVYISRKMIAQVYQSKEAATFAYSLLNKNPTDKSVWSLVYELLAEIIGPNYLDTTISFMKAEKKKTKARSRLRLCDKIIAKLEKDIERLEAIPRLKECYVSQNHSYLAHREHQKMMRKSMDQANEGSLINFVTRVSLKYGRGSFITVNDEVTNPTPMVTHSTSMELPRSEVHHPVYGALQRLNYRMAKRGE
jgi:hypothetical protein